MTPRLRLALAIVLTILAVPPSPGYTQAQTRVQTPTTPTDEQIYEKFLAWLQKQPASGRDIEDQYRKALAAEGLSPSDIDRQRRVVIEQAQKSEKERWNRILTAPG